MSGFKRVPSAFESEKNNAYSLQVSKWFLMPIGTWPRTHTTTVAEKLSTILLIFFCSSVVAIITVPCTLYVLFEAPSIQAKLGALAPLMHRIVGSINYWTLLSRSDDIRKCIHHMETDWRTTRRTEDRKVMLQYAKFGRFVNILSAIFMFGGAFFFCIARMKTVTVVIDNETTITMYPMTCPPYRKIIDARFSPANEIMLVFQFMSTYVTCSSTVCICGLAAVFATHACGQLTVLCAWLNKLTENRDEGKLAEKQLTTIVEHHVRILSFISMVESIMNKSCLAELAKCTIIMVLTGYYTLLNWATFDTAKVTSYVIVYVSMGFNMFIFCYIGEIISEQCKNVGEMAYMTNWYKLRHRTALRLILIITRSSNVIKITAGKLFHLSIVTFGDLIKTSVVYLNMLRAVAM